MTFARRSTVNESQTMARAVRDSIVRHVQTAAGAVVLIGIWEGACRLFNVPPWLLPAPSQVFTEGAEILPILPAHFLATLAAVLGGFFLSIIVGVPLAVMITYSPLLRRIIYPLILMLQSVPKVAIAPILLLWVGYGLRSGIVVAATVAFFPVVISTATGLQSIDPELLELTRSLDSSAWKVFLKVRLPWAMPHVFSGLKVAITLAVIGAIVAEFIGADTGLGYLILANSGSMKTSVVFFVLLVLSLLGIALFYLVEAIERAVCPWYIRDEAKADEV
jgi:NitT/TauT family transport system permease protein